MTLFTGVQILSVLTLIARLVPGRIIQWYCFGFRGNRRQPVERNAFPPIVISHCLCTVYGNPLR